MPALAFLNVAWLWALPLLAVPIVIHLLNRRRFQQRPWAAMEFLLAALKRNRKRLWLEQWLVLLLRALAVALLILLVARPQVADSLLGTQRTHHVLCVDDSASMLQRDGAVSTFQHALELVQSVAAHLAERRDGDLVSLLRGSRCTAPDLGAVQVGAELPARVRELATTFRVSDDAFDVAAVLRAAIARIEASKEAGLAEILMVTDFRQVDWLTSEGKARPEIAALLAGLDPSKVKLKLAQVGPRDAENLAVVEVRSGGRGVIAGVPVPLEAEVKNLGNETMQAQELSLEIDGNRLTRPLEPLGPGESRVVALEHVFPEPGFHGVVATLPADRYPVDDRRALALEVREHSKVLLVDGSPGDSPEESETFFLTAALEPGGDARSGVAVTVVPDHALADTELADYDLIWLCNLGLPAEATQQKLLAYVAAGGGVVWTAGDQVDVPRYNEALWRGGQGPLPAALTESGGDLDAPEGVFLADKAHPLAAVATEALEKLLARIVLVGRWIGTADEAAGGSRVVLRVRDAGGAPLLVHRSWPRGGEMFWLGTTVDKHWTNLPGLDPFLLLVHQLHRCAARVQDVARWNHGPRGQVVFDVDLGLFEPDVVARSVTEEGEEQTFSPAVDSAAAPSARPPVAIPMAALHSRYLFEAVLRARGGGGERRLFARNPLLDEGKLQKLTSAQLLKAYPAGTEERVTFSEAEQLRSSLEREGLGEIWRVLAAAMLLVLLLETLLAWRFGRG
jgi:hypothetical protein